MTIEQIAAFIKANEFEVTTHGDSTLCVVFWRKQTKTSHVLRGDLEGDLFRLGKWRYRGPKDEEYTEIWRYSASSPTFTHELGHVIYGFENSLSNEETK